MDKKRFANDSDRIKEIESIIEEIDDISRLSSVATNKIHSVAEKRFDTSEQVHFSIILWLYWTNELFNIGAIKDKTRGFFLSREILMIEKVFEMVHRARERVKTKSDVYVCLRCNTRHYHSNYKRCRNKRCQHREKPVNEKWLHEVIEDSKNLLAAQ